VLSRFDVHGAAIRDVITSVLSLALLVTAGLLIYRRKLLTFYATRVGELSARRTNWLTLLSGTVLGVLVSISSVGAGAIGVTFLILLYPHLPMASIVGSDIAHAVPLTLVAGLGHWMLGSVDWHVFGSLLVGSCRASSSAAPCRPASPNLRSGSFSRSPLQLLEASSLLTRSKITSQFLCPHLVSETLYDTGKGTTESSRPVPLRQPTF
jgi:Sulfite exporter TauE/SafE